jgi:S1-C subfamily serine protease
MNVIARCALRARGLLVVAACLAAVPAAHADAVATIDRVRKSVVAIGTFERTRTPQFEFRGTGFVVGDGTLVATNAHVLPTALDPSTLEVLGILLPATGDERVRFREARRVAVDPGSDLALLKLDGDKLPALTLRDSDGVKAGQMVLFTGFPIGAALGPYPATHRGMIAAVTPIAIPQAHSGELDPQVIRRLTSGAFSVFQLDATAYPGNSGSPIYDPDSGEVLGIINMVFVKGTKEAALSQPSGITYAIPSKHLRLLLDKSR